jgi:hypothetical protein
MSECSHYWIPSNVDAAGNPDFRMNRQMSAEPLAHVRCKLCGCRTWFTRAQWFAIPAAKEPETERGSDNGWPTPQEYALKAAQQQIDEKDAEIERLKGALDFAPDEIPTSWLDPLLTGPDAIDVDNRAHGVEKLLLALKERMRAYCQKALSE